MITLEMWTAALWLRQYGDQISLELHKRVYEGDYNKKVTEERSACQGEVEGPGPR